MIHIPQFVVRFAALLLLAAAISSPLAVSLASRHSTPASAVGFTILTADGGLPAPPPTPIPPAKKTA